jgi:hypothetical protein
VILHSKYTKSEWLRRARPGTTVDTVMVASGQIKPALTIAFKSKPASLAAGDYLVNCTLRNTTSGEVLSSTNHTVTRVVDGAEPPTAWFDEQQRLIHNGKPRFPLGLYLGAITSDDLALIGKSKFNMIMPYAPPANASVMDEIHANDLTVMFSTKDTYFGGPNHDPKVSHGP